ncbi:type 1 fimbrial protein [Candidatus Sodalis endolongispinus]|uniref:Type 1 fimbrial protein n=1 Tax=Candidatus Sodalis endolongispinus TaxID=2812662 RepID=A0ABS5Y903_9GAMM|nr:fimbrial protein [Candidatus Sodalis endolongispinus]MBT9431464.1 type 1 fimbrial protein [Candidatus Sodalis endolongispinus]
MSLCNRSGDRCLTQNTPWIPGDTLFLRLYKIGNLQGGHYSLPALTLLAASQPVLRIMPPQVSLTTALCRITAKRIEVKFPRVFMTPTPSAPLPAVNFTLPVNCPHAEDYRNVLIQFRYAGRFVDDQTLQTQLSDIGIQVENEDHQLITFNSNNPLPSASFVYRARLVRTAGPAQYGKFNVNATALMTFR